MSVDQQVNDLTVNELWKRGYCVVVFTPEELRGAPSRRVEDSIIEHAWDVIDVLATEPQPEQKCEDC